MSEDFRPRLSDDHKETIEEFRESDHESYKAIMDRILDKAYAWENRGSDVL